MTRYMIKATTSHEAYLEYIHHRYKGTGQLEIEGLDHHQLSKFTQSLENTKVKPRFYTTDHSIIILP